MKSFSAIYSSSSLAEGVGSMVTRFLSSDDIRKHPSLALQIADAFKQVAIPEDCLNFAHSLQEKASDIWEIQREVLDAGSEGLLRWVRTQGKQGSANRQETFRKSCKAVFVDGLRRASWSTCRKFLLGLIQDAARRSENLAEHILIRSKVVELDFSGHDLSDEIAPQFLRIVQSTLD